MKIYSYFENTAEENISQEKINWNELMSKKHKNICKTPNYIEQFLILDSEITGYVSFSIFASLIGLPVEIMSSVIGWKVCAIPAEIKSLSQ